MAFLFLFELVVVLRSWTILGGESLTTEKMTRKELMSEECALGARFKMCEILLTPGKDFIIQVSQLRLVGIMGAILACRDEL